MVLVAVGTSRREVDIWGLTFGQKSITGSGGYAPEDVKDVMEMMTSDRWDIEKLITHRVCREDIAIIVRDSKGSVVMVPHWWYHLYFNKSAESGGLFLLTDNDSGEK